MDLPSSQSIWLLLSTIFFSSLFHEVQTEQFEEFLSVIPDKTSPWSWSVECTSYYRVSMTFWIWIPYPTYLSIDICNRMVQKFLHHSIAY